MVKIKQEGKRVKLSPVSKYLRNKKNVTLLNEWYKYVFLDMEYPTFYFSSPFIYRIDRHLLILKGIPHLRKSALPYPALVSVNPFF